MTRIFLREVVRLNVKEENSNSSRKRKGKIPFAVFVCPKSNNDETEDYKQVFTDIISDRIKQIHR